MNCKHGRFTERHCEECQNEAEYFDDLAEMVENLAEALQSYIAGGDTSTAVGSGILLEAKALLAKLPKGTS